MGAKQYKNELKLICQWCDTHFTNDRFRLFCTHECKIEYNASLGRHLYTQEEEELLSSYIGRYPVSSILKKVKKHFEGVSLRALKQKIEGLAREQEVYIRSRVDNMSIAAWASLLKVNESRIYRWLDKGLKTRRAGNEHMITYGSVRKYASLNPSDFHSIPREILEKVFPDPKHEKYIKEILNAPKPKGIVRKVLCVTTGKVYSSLGAAERETGMTRKRISKVIATGIPARHEDKYLGFRYAD